MTFSCTRFTRIAFTFLLVLLVPLLVGPRPAGAQLSATVGFPNIGFERPLDLEHDPNGRMYVVQQFGLIYSFENDPATTDTLVFLDIDDRVLGNEDLSEAGLLGLAFHPDYNENGYFYVYYTAGDPFRSVVSRFERSAADPTVADPSTEHILFEIEQPDETHQAGDMTFGEDGYLYISVGDGGYFPGRIERAHSQDLTTLFGSILRIDVDNPTGELNYGIPEDNPFAGNAEGYREEIYAYGFRNPWRFSIDPDTGELWVGDVGEVIWEEISIVGPGDNAGWPIVEGPECYEAETCDRSDFVDPVYYHEHGDLGRSITGGFVYRGNDIPSLQGKYVFGDWGGRWIWALERVDEEWIASEPFYTGHFISSFGEDAAGELYFTSFFHNGHIVKITSYSALDTDDPSVPDESSLTLEAAGPNPFRGRTALTIRVATPGHTALDLFSADGRHVRTAFEGFVVPGSPQTVEINADGLAPGVYFVRAVSGTSSVTESVVVAR